MLMFLKSLSNFKAKGHYVKNQYWLTTIQGPWDSKNHFVCIEEFLVEVSIWISPQTKEYVFCKLLALM